MDETMDKKPRREYESPIHEVLDRVRRTETRLTRFMASQGFDTETAKPIWVNGSVQVPSPATSLRDILAVVPPAYGSFPVYIDQELLVEITKPFSSVR